MKTFSDALASLDDTALFRSLPSKAPTLEADSLAVLEESYASELPPECRRLLSLRHSPIIGGRRCEYIVNAAGSLNLLRLFPEWSQEGYLPLGGDGCGNYFVAKLGANGSCPILFMDTMVDSVRPEYVAASSVERFVVAVVEGVNWFCVDTVGCTDPELLSIREYPLPWHE